LSFLCFVSGRKGMTACWRKKEFWEGAHTEKARMDSTKGGLGILLFKWGGRWVVGGKENGAKDHEQEVRIPHQGLPSLLRFAFREGGSEKGKRRKT